MYLTILVLSAALGLALVVWGLSMLRRRPRHPNSDGSSGFYMEYPHALITMNGNAIRAALAATTARRVQGLSGLARMAEDQGMLLKYSMPGPRAIWMKDMEFPLDLVWLRQNRVVDISENVPIPAKGASVMSIPKVRPRVTVDSVLEVNAGVAAKYGLKVGDEVQMVVQEDDV